jgi:hypothetical protein
MRTFLLALAIVAATIFLAVTAQAKRVYCIAAEYARLSPTEWVGISNCGNLWKVVIAIPGVNPDSLFKANGAGKSLGVAAGDSAEAWYYDQANGIWSQLGKVPALGDTLGYVDVDK